jgi:Uma2 family endonuclease
MSAAPLTPPRKRFIRNEVEQMLNTGLFAGQRFELIDGDLIDKIAQNPPHSLAVAELQDWLTETCGKGRVRTQLPIEAAGPERDRTLPEPDLAVTVGDSRTWFRSRHPRGDELVLVVEVADSTSRCDLTTKRDIYARAGVPEYWVFDIAGRKLIAHSRLVEGGYSEVRTFGEGDSVSLPSRPESSLAISQLLA